MDDSDKISLAKKKSISEHIGIERQKKKSIRSILKSVQKKYNIKLIA